MQDRLLSKFYYLSDLMVVITDFPFRIAKLLYPDGVEIKSVLPDDAIQRTNIRIAEIIIQ